jgi:hypothetical protein
MTDFTISKRFVMPEPPDVELAAQLEVAREAINRMLDEAMRDIIERRSTPVTEALRQPCGCYGVLHRPSCEFWYYAT